VISLLSLAKCTNDVAESQEAAVYVNTWHTQSASSSSLSSSSSFSTFYIITLVININVVIIITVLVITYYHNVKDLFRALRLTFLDTKGA